MRRLAQRLSTLFSAILRPTRVVVIDSLPAMDASSAVFPTVRVIDDVLVLSYHRPGCDSSAVVRFNGVSDWYYGPPNDEGLSAHAMRHRGVTYYSFHEVGPARAGLFRWVATFHEGTLIVRGRTVQTISREIASTPWEAIDATCGPGRSVVLDADGDAPPKVMRVSPASRPHQPR